MNARQASALLAVATLLSGCGGSSSDRPAAAAAAAAVTSAHSSAQAATLAPSQVSRLPGKMADYSVVRDAGTVTVTDLTGHHPTIVLAGVTRLLFADVVLALDSNTAPSKVFRLYQAAFDRAPDLAGLGFHITAVEAMGASLDAVATGFIASDEFSTRYGALDNANFVNQLYLNVLHRAPDAAGKKFWTELLDAKTLTRAAVLNQFAESPENVANVAPAIAAGVAYIPYISGGAATAVAIGGSEATAGWNADTLINVSLRAQGVVDVVGKNLKCEALDPTRLTVDANCITAKGYRLGEQQMRISADGLSAILTLRIIPQRQALGTQGNARHHNIVTTAAGGALAWGYNGGNVLGQGGAIPGSNNWSNLPLPVKELSGVVATSIGDTDAMALTASGNVLAWAGSQSFARTTLSSKLPSLVRNSANDGSLDKIVQVEVGMSNAVALADDGQVWTWGQYPGQGTGTGAYPDHPLLASGAPLSNIVQVAAGGLFSLALAEDGKVYAWGWNGHGQTGRGTVNTKEDYAAPVRLASDNSELTGVIAISAGYHHSLALTADGKVYAWGDNAYSEIGQGVRAGDYPRAVLVKGPGAGTGLLGNIAMVAAGGNHSYALDKLGNVWSWGLNNTGELGDGLNSNLGEASLPRPVVGVDASGQLSGIVSIAAAYEHGLALQSDGTVLVWGNGFGGNLGQGNDTWTERGVPTPVKFGSGNLVLSPLTAYSNLLRIGR